MANIRSMIIFLYINLLDYIYLFVNFHINKLDFVTYFIIYYIYFDFISIICIVYMNKKIDQGSKILEQSTYADILYMDNHIAELLDNSIENYYKDEVIVLFFDWFDKLILSNSKQFLERYDSVYDNMVAMIYNVLLEDEKYGNYFYKIKEEITKTIRIVDRSDTDLFDRVDENLIIEIMSIQAFAKRLKSKYSKNIYETKKSIEWVIGISYKKQYVSKIIQQYPGLSVQDFYDFLDKNGKISLVNSWITKDIYDREYKSDDLWIDNTMVVRIEDFLDKYSDFSKSSKQKYIIANELVYKLMMDFFACQNYGFFDNFITTIRNVEKIEEMDFAMNNVSKFLKRKEYMWLYKFVSMNKEYDFLNKEYSNYDDVVDSKNLLLSNIFQQINAVPKCIGSQGYGNEIYAVDEFGNKIKGKYVVKIWLNHDFKIAIFVYCNFYSKDSSGNNQFLKEIQLECNEYVLDEDIKTATENAYYILTEIWRNQNPYDAIWMKPEDINYKL